MPDLAPVQNAIRVPAGAVGESVQVGEAVVTGDMICQDLTDPQSRWFKTNAILTNRVGEPRLCLTDAGVDENVMAIRWQGQINVGDAATQGEPYILSGNAGKIAPTGDKASTWNVRHLGEGTDGGAINAQAAGGKPEFAIV